jgi:superoxide reductase
MPRIFTYSDFADKATAVKTYADKHTPVILCEAATPRGTLFCVKVRIGMEAAHPVTPAHHFTYVQLWNLETLVGEVRLEPKAFHQSPLQVEVAFFLQPHVSLRLTALAYCNKHGLWRSEERFVKVLGAEHR